VSLGAKRVGAAGRMCHVGWWHLAVRLIVVAALALVVVGCSSVASGANLQLRITKAFDDRAEEADLWNSGTITADGTFSAAKLDTMDMDTEYAWNLLGSQPWTASTNQQVGDFEGECNGSEDCRPCVGVYGKNWEIASVNLTMQERGNGRYVFELWLGSDAPPKVSGCDFMTNDPVYWADRITVTLTGLGSAKPSASADGYTVEVTQ
jgi:hypothetical protein